MQHLSGLVPLDYDARTGKLYLEVQLTADPEHTRSVDLLYVTSLPHGMGSNDLGLDRGQIGGSGGGNSGRLVRFERSGPKVLLLQPNGRFRSSAAGADEQRSVRESFADSVLWGFKVEAEAPDGTVLLDATDFFVRDARGVTEVLAQQKQGAYKFDALRSALRSDGLRAFPKNTVVESTITLTTDSPSNARFVRDVTPDPHAVTVVERQMFVALPEPGFTPRRFSPRSGLFPDASFRDYSAPLGDDLEQKFIARHRLVKKDPACTRSCAPITPIQYYVDRGAPEPVRTALVEGARWWDTAFQAAGWAPGTFRVEVLPEGADPMDIRYNMIQWVHRYTRGWSYGAFIADPRTGEIIKGQVTLGSLRGRQDYLIAEALLAPYAKGKKPANDAALAMVLQRMRQLAAHETGHTLGLAHNFAASAWPHPPDVTASVMDYPHPWVTLGANGVPDLSHAYPAGIGVWDKTAIDYAYREFDHGGTPVEDPRALDAILSASEKTGMQFIIDEDARPLGSAHPHAHLWDNGVSPAEELERVLKVRSAAIERFGEAAIKPGTDLAQLQDTFVPLFLLHRYQVEAAAKEIGGLDYRYNVRGDGQPLPSIVGNEEQKRALAALLRTLSPEALTLDEQLLRQLVPRPPGLPRTRESFPTHTGLTFDPLAAAESAADLTLAALLEPARAARVVQYHMRTPPSSPSLREIMEAISKATAERIDDAKRGGHTMSAEVERAVEFRGLEAMLTLAANQEAASQVRAIALSHVNKLLNDWTAAAKPTDSAEAIHRAAMIDRIQQFQRAPEKFVAAKPVEAPPGMPIGDEGINDSDDWNTP